MLLIGQKDYIHRVNSCWQKTDGWISKYCEEGITEKFWCLDNKIYYECWFSFRIHLIATCLYECARNLGRRFQKTNANWTVFSFNLETCGGGWGWLWYINFFLNPQRLCTMKKLHMNGNWTVLSVFANSPLTLFISFGLVTKNPIKHVFPHNVYITN